jgi:hypothetical protein
MEEVYSNQARPAMSEGHETAEGKSGAMAVTARPPVVRLGSAWVAVHLPEADRSA